MSANPERDGDVPIPPLCQEISSQLGWADLHFSVELRRRLDEIVAWWRHRDWVADRWRFGRRLKSRGLVALLAGPSGTGKTEAVSVIAGILGMRVLLVNTSALLSKYIGETERNIGILLTAAEEVRESVTLVFDECDALFGKRIEAVRGSGDVAHNSQVGLLLSRIERFGGLAFLTTNNAEAIDPAFKRRFAVYVQFDPPDAAARREILKLCLAEAPLADDLDLDCLSDIELAGGAIQNIAVRAAHSSLARGQELIDQRALWHAVVEEMRKNGKLVRESEEGRRP